MMSPSSEPIVASQRNTKNRAQAWIVVLSIVGLLTHQHAWYTRNFGDFQSALTSSFNSAQLHTIDETLQASGDETQRLALTPLEQLNLFLKYHPETPGARFIKLLRNHLHYAAGSENQRMNACTSRHNNGLTHCLTGHHPSNTTSQNPSDTSMPLNSTLSVYEMPRYPGMDHLIPALGTLPSCLPLFLAGASVVNGMTIELGPYFGLSSKCLVTGMKTNGVRENAYLAFDTFDGLINFNSIKKKREHQWILKSFPSYSESNTSFLLIWERAVQPVYPTAQGRPGLISASTLNLETIGLLAANAEGGQTQPDKHSNATTIARGVDLISVDSAKRVEQLQSQLAGLGRLVVGTILFLLDFEYVPGQVKLVYGCLRHSGYLLPVYTAWARRENWAFVVTKEFSFSDFTYPQCAEGITLNRTFWLEQDIRLLTSLGAGAADDTNNYDEDEAVALTKGRVDDLYATMSKILGLAQQGDSSAISALKPVA